MRRIASVLILSVILLIALPAAVHAAPVFVSVFGSDAVGDGSPGNPYASVQHAIDMAGAGNDVYVGAGTFVENVVMKDGVSLYGAGADETTLMGVAASPPPVVATRVSAMASAVADDVPAPTGGTVVTASSIGDGETISGFTITRGSGSYGGGIVCAFSSPTITNNTIIGNSSTWHAGGIIANEDSSPTITNNTIADNMTGGSGGGIYCWSSVPTSPTISGNTITGNTATYDGGGISCEATSSPTISDNAITGNTSYSGGGIYFEFGALMIEDNTISGNSGGGIYCFESPMSSIVGNTITNNSVLDGAGGGIFSHESLQTILGNTITGNSASTVGGGIFIGYASPSIVDNVINSNDAYEGGGIGCYSSSPTITNNTITDNDAAFLGGGISSFSGFLTITNCIIWDNGDDLSGCSATYSDIEDGDAGLGNISASPSFAGTATVDFRLTSGSPCIDVATSTAAPAADKIGVYRPQGAGYDMGAYEYFPLADAAPIDPALSSVTHMEGVWSLDPDITIDIVGAAGTVAPVDGFAISVSMNATEYPVSVATHDATTTSFEFSAIPDGVYYVNVATVDDVGNWSVGAHYGPIMIDTIDPIDPTLGSPSHMPGVWSTETSITLSLSGADGTGSGVGGYSIEWTQDAATIPTQTITHSATTTSTTFGASEGAWYAHVSTADEAGNWTSTAHFGPLKIDQTGPMVTDDSTSAWQMGPVTLTFTEADAGADSSMFYYSLDGSAEATTMASMVATGTGVHELEYYGVDSVGNAGPLGHATLRLDNDVPVSSSDIDSVWQQGPVDVTIAATDAHSGVNGITATITDPLSAVTPMSVMSDTMTFTVSVEGTTTVDYFATDNVGNMEIPLCEMVRVDYTAPVVSMAPLATAAIDTVTFKIAATDSLSGVAGIYYSLDSGPMQASDTVTVNKVGDHTITFWAVDIAGNESAHDTQDVRVSPSKTKHVGVSGADRYATAVAVSMKSFPDGADAVIIATGVNWPDALGGAALAGVYDAPVLLTGADSLPPAVAAEIERLDPGHVFVLGGTAVVSENIEAQIRALVVPTANLERFWGASRYVTTEIIAARVTRESLLFDGTAFVATGRSFPDALAAAPIATALQRPLYLAGPSGLGASTLSAMKDAGVTDVVILGGESAVSASVEAQLAGEGIAHTRLAGLNRYETALKIAKSGVFAGLSWDKVALACGTDFPDALSGGVMQGHDSSVMVLTPCDSLNSGVKDTLEANRDIIGEVRYIGGDSAIEQSVRDAVKQVLW
ncbi:MAG: cell wall-binding repeat-containing protein [Actinomycetota bacterium]|jgi:parallel beta-helix repeat protein|nr:cell wall-binding repeat-containing protein [Actinomycetota bacterium]